VGLQKNNKFKSSKSLLFFQQNPSAMEIGIIISEPQKNPTYQTPSHIFEVEIQGNRINQKRATPTGSRGASLRISAV
jgi:hypothetical protein